MFQSQISNVPFQTVTCASGYNSAGRSGTVLPVPAITFFSVAGYHGVVRATNEKKRIDLSQNQRKGVITYGYPFFLNSMLHLPSRSAVLRFRLTAVGWLLLLLLVPGAVAMACFTLFVMKREPAGIALILIGLAVLVFLMYWMLSLRARCPRCLVGSFTRRSCSRHGSARSLLGSHRLKVAVSVIFKNHFQCPYCGEFTAMKPRQPRSSRRSA